MGMHGGEMVAGSHMMGGGVGMMLFGLVYLALVIVFFWFLYRLVTAAEEIAENTRNLEDRGG